MRGDQDHAHDDVTGHATQKTESRVSKPRRYKFGFILSTSLGNVTRYANFKKFAELDGEIDFVWAPVKYYFSPEERNPFLRIPRFLQSRAIVIFQSAPVLKTFSSFDAVMIHLYAVDVLTALRGYAARRTLRVISSDAAPATDPATYPFL
jgi:hypothetical protein